ncbi:MAG: hypothetical protein ABFD29_07775 [Anaerolineaceae bacterium]|jgi:hypothetical protein
MLDDLRNSAEASFVEEESPKPDAKNKKTRKKGKSGLTAAQRFVIVFMLFLMVLVLGVFFLLISGSIVLP